MRIPNSLSLITRPAALFALLACSSLRAAPGTEVPAVVRDQLRPPAPGEVRLGGLLGGKIDLCIRKRIMTQDVEHLVAPFRKREETRQWQSEFWGKWFTSLALAWRYDRAPAEARMMERAARELIATQSPDGYIGNYRADKRLEQWDIWGRKYCLLGLLSEYDALGDSAALCAADRLAAHLLSQVGPEKTDIVLTGNYRGMASSSVLEPIVDLYRRTGEARYLDFARYIVGRWESEKGPGLIGKALAGVPVAGRFPPPKSWWTWENGAKAYEMMSCYEGLCELYRVTGKPDYLEACRKTWIDIRDSEINLAGSGSAQECWYGGRNRQTLPVLHMMETCVTVTWIKFCAQMLRLTGDPKYADALEIALYNALLGAMTPDGKDFAKYSPLIGHRSPGDNQCDMDLHCCNANGPRGLLMAPQVAVMESDSGPVVNLYDPLDATVSLPSGNRVEIVLRGDYPLGGSVTIHVKPERPERFTLRLRVPAWSARSVVRADNAELSAVEPGSYARVTRSWSSGDSVSLELDMRGRVVPDPGGSQQIAVMRGPVLLTRDSRLGDGDVDAAFQAPMARDGFIELEREESAPKAFGMVFRAPMIDDPSGRDSGVVRSVILCDFASAGNDWAADTRYRVWLPLLLDLSRRGPAY